MTHESYELKLFEISKIAKSVLEGEDDTQKVHFSKTMLDILRDSLGRETLSDFIKDDGKLKVTDLPNEVLIQILRYLPTRDFMNILPVCKHFYEIINQPNFFKSLVIRWPENDRFATHITKKSQNLKILDLTCMHFPYNFVSRTLKFCEKLEVLRIHSDAGRRVSKKLMSDIAEFCKNLEHLYLDCQITLEGQKLIAKLANLKSLTLRYNFYFMNSNYTGKIVHNESDILIAMSQFKQLETFTINNGYIDCSRRECRAEVPNEEAFKLFFEGRQKTLKILMLKHHFNFNDNCMAYLDLCAKLEHLSLVFHTPTVADVTLEAIGKLPCLKTLILGNINSTSKMFGYLFANLNLKNLEELTLLSCPELNVNAIEILLDHIGTNLKRIVLDSCRNLRLNDGILARLIEKCPKLITIHYPGTLVRFSAKTIFELQKKNAGLKLRVGANYDYEEVMKLEIEDLKTQLFHETDVSKKSQIETSIQLKQDKLEERLSLIQQIKY